MITANVFFFSWELQRNIKAVKEKDKWGIINVLAASYFCSEFILCKVSVRILTFSQLFLYRAFGQFSKLSGNLEFCFGILLSQEKVSSGHMCGI